MRNDALLIPGGVLNPFTRTLRDTLMVRWNRPLQVKMRNGDWCEVRYLPGDFEGHPYDPERVPDGGFVSADNSRYWHADGRSLTSRDFDLIEIPFEEKDC
jgi:hypothetical protein